MFHYDDVILHEPNELQRRTFVTKYMRVNRKSDKYICCEKNELTLYFYLRMYLPSISTQKKMTTVEDLKKAQDLVDALLKEKNCGPVMVRLAWHDSGTFDVNIKEAWPKAGGAIGSIRFAPEINHGANAGLAGAVALLEPIKEAVPR